MIEGYIKRKRWIRCKCIGGPYEFKNVVRLRVGNHEEIVQAADFFTTKPQTQWQLDRAARKEEKKQARLAFVMAVKSKLTEPMPLAELSRSAGFHHSVVCQRIAYWLEFNDVDLSGAKPIIVSLRAA